MNRNRLIAAAAVALFVSASTWAQVTTNPHFDVDLTGWDTFSEPNHQWSPVDAGDATGSGSLLAFKDFAGSSLVRATQCIPVSAGMKIHFMVHALVLDSGDTADITIDLTPNSDTQCQSPTGLNRVIETPPLGRWVRIVHGPHIVEDGVQSITVGLGLNEVSGATVPVSAHFDDALFFLFADGFDGGTCGEWSSSTPFCETPEIGLRVEVSWETAGDPDPGDEVGTDLDLHLLHPDASGEWMGAFDCYQANSTPDWGTPGNSNDPVLVREDGDGSGPETVQITDPESVEYDIGVDYLDDLGFGPSNATVTVLVDGSPVYQYPGKTLLDGQFWDFGSVEWPGGAVTLVDSVTDGVP